MPCKHFFFQVSSFGPAETIIAEVPASPAALEVSGETSSIPRSSFSAKHSRSKNQIARSRSVLAASDEKEADTENKTRKQKWICPTPGCRNRGNTDEISLTHRTLAHCPFAYPKVYFFQSFKYVNQILSYPI